MLSKNKIKYIQSLRLKKNRLKNSSFLVEGEKIVEELLHDGKIKIDLLCASPAWIETHPFYLSLFKEKLIPTNESELSKISNLSTPNQILAVAQMPPPKLDYNGVEKQLSLYLDGIQDPGNMGTILRIADWFGISKVFCSMQCADLYNPKVIQASMGAFLRVDCHRVEFDKLLEECPNIITFGAVLEGENLFQQDLPKSGMIVIGNESKGISEEVLQKIQHKISIPAAAANGAESLNAGVATGIICAFFLKNSL